MSLRTQVLSLAAAAIALPVLILWGAPHLPSLQPPVERYSGGQAYPPSPRQFAALSLGDPALGLPLIANVRIVDADRDGRHDVLVCDVSRNRVTLITRDDRGSWRETTLAADVSVPAHASLADLDGDGDDDLAVAVLGNIMPDDNVVGRVEVFEHRAGEPSVRHVVLDDVRRVADVQPADLDGDGDIDLAVAVFGYARGQVLWLENLGGFEFREHELLNAPGTIHLPIADYDGDGDPDIAAIVTQDEEELWGFENLGGGTFAPRRLWFTINYDLGGAGLVQADLDQDGDFDLILPAGDNLEDLDAYPQPYHGCYWFENLGNWSFEPRRIADLGGAYAADVGDLDGDGDLDLALVSMANDWQRRDTASIVWLENDGRQNFTAWQVGQDPIHLVTVAVGDLDGDGAADIVAGSLNFRKPYERIGRVTAWFHPPRNAP